jgi:hypothetical protein
MLGVTYKTAWFMSMRIREGMKPAKPAAMGGEGKIVEADATYQGKRDRRSGRSTFVSGFGWTSPPPYDSLRKVFSLVPISPSTLMESGYSSLARLFW